MSSRIRQEVLTREMEKTVVNDHSVYICRKGENLAWKKAKRLLKLS